MEKFEELLKEQKKRARDARKNAGAEAWLSDAVDFGEIQKTKFIGYTDLKADSKILAVVKDGEKVEFAGTGDEIIVVLDTTPFYAESGGQVGDIGTITTETAKIQVKDTIKDNNGIYMHRCIVTEGAFENSDSAKAEVDYENRYSIMRNHTAAHLLQAALRKVLGTHVEQAGQLVTADKLRFDFTHFSALTETELKTIENLVNEEIFKGINVVTKEMPIEEAKKLGAMALFGEKYGDVVRVVMIDEFSKEFCGGTHIENTAKIGLFRILSEGSVASGVRRIEAVTGRGVLDILDTYSNIISDSMKVVKATNMNNLKPVCEHTVNELKEKDKEIEKLTSKLVCMSIDSLVDSAEETNGIKIIKGKFLYIGSLKGLETENDNAAVKY